MRVGGWVGGWKTYRASVSRAEGGRKILSLPSRWVLSCFEGCVRWVGG